MISFFRFLGLAAALSFSVSAGAVTCTPPLATPSNPDGIYTDNGDGTVTDTRTGLMWKRCAQGQTWDVGMSTCTGSATDMNWSTALSSAEGDGFALHTDWRLPSIRELQTLVEFCRASGGSVNDTIFPNLTLSPVTTTSNTSVFLSSSPDRNNNANAWAVEFGLLAGQTISVARHNFQINIDLLGFVTIPTHARLVRGGQSFAAWGVSPVAPTVNSTAPFGGPAVDALTMDYLVTFSEGVSGVTQNDFRLRADPPGSVLAALNGAPICHNPGTCSEWRVPVSITGGDGALFLDVKSWGTGIKNAGNAELNRAHIAVAGSHTVFHPIAGGCGASSGGSFATAPAVNLCNPGTPSAVTKAGANNRWAWTCAGLAGGASTAVGACTALAPPDPPTAVTATPYNAQAVVTWTAPAQNGGSPITGYTVFRYPDGSIACTTAAGTINCTVAGLANGTGYTFRAWATNVVGNSVLSDPSNGGVAVIPDAALGNPPGGGGGGGAGGGGGLGCGCGSL